MRKNFITIFILGFVNFIFSQNEIPKDYFTKPLEIPLLLSGTFGELRTNHFHAGLDIKTQKVEGHKVLSSADGYVSRINVSLWGYGNALYVTHPNGYTTVYGHLQKFSPEIDAYVRKMQYEKESFSIRLYPKPNELIVKQGEVIALSGNSGSSGGPHLHYEIRDVKSNILNPMLFGINVPDHKNPTIQNAFAYSKNENSQVNQSSNNVQLVFSRQYDGDLLANTIYAHGEIGFGINAYDRLDGALNRNGLYSFEMTVNGEKVFQFTVNKFSFDESRFINSYIDYERLVNLKQRVQKCFVNHDMNNLSLYKTLDNKGFVNVKDSLEYTVSIIAKDFEGNKTRLIIPIKGKKDSIIIPKTVKKTPYFFKTGDFHDAQRFPLIFHHFGFQDGFQNDPKSTQDRPKTVSKSMLFHVQIRIRFWFVFRSVLVPSWLPFRSPSKDAHGTLWAKRDYRQPMTPQDAPRPLMSPPKTTQECPKTPR